jgi:hypothetical protein
MNCVGCKQTITKRIDLQTVAHQGRQGSGAEEEGATLSEEKGFIKDGGLHLKILIFI